MDRLHILDRLDAIPEAEWNRLHDGGNPFLAHRFLSGLEHTGCLREHWGWRPQHAALYRDDQLVAAAPAYLKHNSHGEFVFDHAWADAYARNGLDYYPKWLIAIPYSPVPGPRLLARDDRARAAICRSLQQHCQDQGWSSLHINFLPEAETVACPSEWLARRDIQFHWRNPVSETDPAWTCFEDFLASLTHKKRKNIRAERAQVARAGVSFERLDGDRIGAAELAEMHDLYCQGFFEKGNSPALTLAFFQHLAETMADALVLILARLNGRIIAGALCLRGRDRLYGRYWGSRIELPGLHFETCYYQGIEYCLEHGLHHFEPGAQGEHKLARGFLPTCTHSRHWLAHPIFHHAIDTWCRQDRDAVDHYHRAALLHSPFRESKP
ncbi:MAG TPA: GNAT family N-acetyltransferase [Xanthomonadales bacterium]|nr:GNAT family N-acetyltransferase [Xanthomonadales bacterium]